MSSSRDDVFGYFPETLHIPAGVTCEIKPIAGQIGGIMKYISGGSFVILRTTEITGATTTGTSFTVNNLYVLGTSEIMSVAVSGSTWITATGATLVANVLRFRSIGT